ncbi:MAG: hypothetical protein ACOYL5_02020 [Phototrophicaceae bacterium]|jgi:hypothetical protein
METALTILYTHHLAGALDLFPRVATLLKRIKATIHTPLIVLDAGDACQWGIEICDQTQGRAAPILLDAMGYAAANVSGYVSAQGQEKLTENYLNMALVSAGQAASLMGGTVSYGESPLAGATLHIRLSLAMAVTYQPSPVGILTLQPLTAGQVGQVTLAAGQAITEIHPLLAEHLPEPTIAAALDFIREEARYYGRRR